MSWTMLTKADSSQIKIILQTENRIKQRLITKEVILITMQLCDWQTKGNPWMAFGKDRLQSCTIHLAWDFPLCSLKEKNSSGHKIHPFVDQAFSQKKEIAFLTFFLLWSTVSLLPIFQISWKLHPLPPLPPPPPHTHTLNRFEKSRHHYSCLKTINNNCCSELLVIMPLYNTPIGLSSVLSCCLLTSSHCWVPCKEVMELMM